MGVVVVLFTEKIRDVGKAFKGRKRGKEKKGLSGRRGGCRAIMRSKVWRRETVGCDCGTVLVTINSLAPHESPKEAVTPDLWPQGLL